jgi:thioredoxin 1
MDFIDQNHYRHIIEKNEMVLVCLWASWCSGCKRNVSVLRRMTIDSPVKLFFINWDENKAFLQKQHIFGLPMLLVYRDGQLKKRISGTLVPADSRFILSEFE